MGLYDRYVLPRVINCVCGLKPMARQREKVVPLARGQVLEIGLGSGLNLPFYDRSQVTGVIGIDPSAGMNRLAERAIRETDLSVELIPASAEDIPLEENSVDTVLVTYTLCTIPDADSALKQMHRVLKPDGQLIFCEHGAAPDASVRRWQDRLDRVWGVISGGCHLNRVIPDLIEAAGFRIRDVDTMYLPGWKPASFNYWGTAVTAG